MNEITHQERSIAASHAKSRREGGVHSGRYAVTVGGYVVGYVVKTEASRTTYWNTQNADGYEFGRTFDTLNGGRRRDAVHAVGRTDYAVQAYRMAALEGAFGDQAMWAERKRTVAALPIDDSDPERDEDGTVTEDLVDHYRFDPGRMITADDIRYHVQQMVDASEGDYDVEAIVEEIIRKLGRIDLAAVEGSEPMGQLVWEIIGENKRPEGSDPYITPDLFRPDDDAGALDRGVLAFAAQLNTDGDDVAAVRLTTGMAYVREAVRNPLPQGADDPHGLVQQLRELAENATDLAFVIARHANG